MPLRRKNSNVVVAMGGGPTPVINNSLRGIIEGCRENEGQFGTVWGAHHGVVGLLREQLLDLSTQNPEEISLLRTTPAAGAIGTARYKLQSAEDLARAVEVFRAHGVGYFFGIGGNDTQGVCLKLKQTAAATGYDLKVVGVPKTIDNDLGDPELEKVDHTPGFGSVARYWAWTLQCLEEENRGSAPADPVLVVQAMGRRVGFVPAAARLSDPHRETPLLILLAESAITLEEITDRVADTVRRNGRAVVVISEGLSLADLGERRDAFGHASFSSSRTTAADLLVNHLNDVGLPVGGLARGQVPGTEQRNAMLHASPVDLDEAYHVGRTAVSVAADDLDGVMVSIGRAEGPVYRPRYATIRLEEVADVDRPFPCRWIAPCKMDVSDGFIEYARPLLGEDAISVPVVAGRLRFARLQPVFAEQRLSPYVPTAYRDAD